MVVAKNPNNCLFCCCLDGFVSFLVSKMALVSSFYCVIPFLGEENLMQSKLINLMWIFRGWLEKKEANSDASTDMKTP